MPQVETQQIQQSLSYDSGAPTGPAPFESWGRYPTYGANIIPLHWQSDFLAATRDLHNGALPVGMGRSYGDVCLLKDGNLLSPRAWTASSTSIPRPASSPPKPE